jgi:CDP-diacylglycerol--serine O-phosphatidyltransferase
VISRHIPNIITLCNLAIGVLAVLMALENQVIFASWLILAAALLDFLDGFLARILDAASELGKQLDSFADLVSFGMAPSALAYKLMEYGLLGDIFQTGIQDTSLVERLLLFSPILIVLFAALRLAEFNIMDDSTGFRGLPTPAAAIYFAGSSLALVHGMGTRITEFFLQPAVILANIAIISILMVSRIPMFSLKFVNILWKGNQIRYIFLAVSGILLIILQEIALPVIILFYLLLSIASSVFRNNTK